MVKKSLIYTIFFFVFLIFHPGENYVVFKCVCVSAKIKIQFTFTMGPWVGMGEPFWLGDCEDSDTRGRNAVILCETPSARMNCSRSSMLVRPLATYTYLHTALHICVAVNINGFIIFVLRASRHKLIHNRTKQKIYEKKMLAIV